VIADTWEARRGVFLCEVSKSLSAYVAQCESAPPEQIQEARSHCLAAIKALNTITAVYVTHMLDGPQAAQELIVQLGIEEVFE
jgi:hypothetical protein